MKIYNKDGEVIVDYPKAKTHAEALTQGLKDNIDFINAELSGMKLQSLKLGGICLIGAKCVGTDFAGTDFEGKDSKGKIHRADLSFANFTGVNFTGASLKDAKLMESNFTGATMINTNLTWTSCEDANFSNAILKGAKFDNANLQDAIGNGKEMTRISTEQYNIIITKDFVQIGCEVHTLEEWLSFDDETIESFDDDNDALMWWIEWRPKLEELNNTRGNGKEIITIDADV